MDNLIQICDDFIVKLSIIQDISDKKALLFQADEVINALLELKIEDPYQFDRIIDNIGEQFTRGKGTTIKTIKDIIDKKQKEKFSEKVNKFTDADVSNLPTRNGMIVATPKAYEEILAGARRIKFVYDTLTASTYLTKIDWEVLDAPFELKMLDGTIEVYHKYESESNRQCLRRTLNGGPFPTEIHFSHLDEAVTNVAKNNKIDFAVKWLLDCEGIWDGKDRRGWSVRCLGAPGEEWSYTWERIFAQSLVRRILEPACPLRYYFAIEGDQNIGKTEFCRSLVPQQWYISVDASKAIDDNTEYYRATYDKIVIEEAELPQERKATNARKRLITETHSTFRKMRADPVIAYPKRNIIIVTTNDSSYLRDDTGETRPLPIKSLLASGQFMNLDLFKEEWPQILAQAIIMYRENNNYHYLTPGEQTQQKLETSKRNVAYDTFEYEVLESYFNFNDNMEIAKAEGIYLDQIYTYMESYQLSKAQCMKHSRALSRTLKIFGFYNDDNKTYVVPGQEGKRAKMWFYKK